jgi:hypothetical protein
LKPADKNTVTAALEAIQDALPALGRQTSIKEHFDKIQQLLKEKFGSVNSPSSSTLHKLFGAHKDLEIERLDTELRKSLVALEEIVKKDIQSSLSHTTANGNGHHSSVNNTPRNSRSNSKLNGNEEHDVKEILSELYAIAKEQQCTYIIDPNGIKKDDPTSKYTELVKRGGKFIEFDRELFLHLFNYLAVKFVVSDLPDCISTTRRQLVEKLEEIYDNMNDYPGGIQALKRTHFHWETKSESLHKKVEPTLMNNHITQKIAEKNEIIATMKKNLEPVSSECKQIELQLKSIETLKKELKEYVTSLQQASDAHVKCYTENRQNIGKEYIKTLQNVELGKYAKTLQFIATQRKDLQPYYQQPNSNTVNEDIDKLSKEIGNINTKLDQWRTEGAIIACIGGEKAGKSTFINSLIGFELFLSDEARCSMVLTYLYFGIRSATAPAANAHTQYELILEYCNHDEAKARLQDLENTQGIAKMTADGYTALRAKIDKFYLQRGPNPPHEPIRTNDLEEIKTRLRETGGRDNELAIFLFKTVKIYFNAANPYTSFPFPMCFVDCPGFNSTFIHQREFTEEIMRRADCIFYIHSVNESREISMELNEKLTIVLDQASIARGHNPNRESTRVKLLDSDPTKHHNFFFIANRLDVKDGFTQNHETCQKLVEELRKIQVENVFFPDARIPLAKKYALAPANIPDVNRQKTESIIIERNNGGTITPVTLLFNVCTSDWLEMFKQFQSYVSNNLPWLLVDRTLSLIDALQHQVRQLHENYNVLSRDARNNLLSKSKYIKEEEDRIQAEELEKKTMELDAGKDSYYSSYGKQKLMEFKIARDNSYQEEIDDLHFYGSNSSYEVKLSKFLQQFHNKWKSLVQAKSYYTDSYVQKEINLFREGISGPYVPLGVNILWAEVQTRSEMTQQFNHLFEELTQHMAKLIHQYLDGHYTKLITTPYHGDSDIKAYLHSNSIAYFNGLLMNITKTLGGSLIRTFNIIRKVMLFPPSDPYNERKSCFEEIKQLFFTDFAKTNDYYHRQIQKKCNEMQASIEIVAEPNGMIKQIDEHLNTKFSKFPWIEETNDTTTTTNGTAIDYEKRKQEAKTKLMNLFEMSNGIINGQVIISSRLDQTNDNWEELLQNHLKRFGEHGIQSQYTEVVPKDERDHELIRLYIDHVIAFVSSNSNTA